MLRALRKKSGRKAFYRKNVVSVDVKLKKKLAVIRSREKVDDTEITALVTDAGYKVLSIESK